MKRTLLTFTFLAGIGSAYSQNVNIPDPNFKAYLLSNTWINTNMDTEIQVTEANAFTGLINCPSQGISDFTGLEEFTALTGLYCYNNFTNTSIDVSMMPNLEQLFCSSNAITQLDVSNNPNLTFLACDQNALTSLNVANGNNSNMPGGSFFANSNPSLSCIQVDDIAYSTSNWTNVDAGASFSLLCNSCIVTVPDANFKAYLVGNAAINTNMDAEIQCSEASAFTGGINCNLMSITDLTGIEAFTSLSTLECSTNPIGTLDLSSNLALSVLFCNSTSLTSLALPSSGSFTNLIAQSNSLTTLNLSTVPNLSYLHVGGNSLTTLDVSSNVALEALYCNDNLLSGIDLSSNANLTALNISGNNISTLDLSNNPALMNLTCQWNSLSALDVSSNTNLSVLRCYNNTNITGLDLSSNSALTILECQDNSIADLNVANGNNTAITMFNATGIPATCIQVDDAAYSTANWAAIDAGTSFSEDCSGGAGLEEFNNLTMIISPNPTSSTLNIEVEAAIESIHIFCANGTFVQSETTNNFSVESLDRGVYLINVKTANGVITQRFIKE